MDYQWLTEILFDDVDLFFVRKEKKNCQDRDYRQKRMPFPETSLLHSEPVWNNRKLTLDTLRYCILRGQASKTYLESFT